jgi:hypothetical protein
MAELMRFRIPGGWAVSGSNHFYDVDPVFREDGSIINWHEGFVEDVLWIQECRFINGKFQCPETECLCIDLHWSDGHYTATLAYCAPTRLYTVEFLSSPDRFQIRDKVESWLADISARHHEFMAEMRERFPE